jgi:hypothetical protein
MENNTLETLVNKAVFYRGSIINEWIHLEKAIEGYICHYFTQDISKQEELFNVLVDRLTFDSKRLVLKTLLDRNSELNGFKKTKKNSYPYSDLMEELRKINLERNYFAHYLFDYSNHAIINCDKQLTLLEFRDKTKRKTYKEEEYVQLRQRIFDAHNKVNELLGKLIN